LDPKVTLLLPDTSVWHRNKHPAVAPLWVEHLRGNRLAITEITKLEYLYSARSGIEYDALALELDALQHIPTTAAAVRRALEVQASLAHRAGLHHRLAIRDLLIAAVAELAGATVWHYDSDYDRIAEVTGQPVEWIAPRGSL